MTGTTGTTGTTGEYYNNESLHCSCVECYENRLVEVLEGPLAFYYSYIYRESEAFCPDCASPSCDRCLYHGNKCESVS